nr:hypothetical protein [Vibrio lentus]MCC4838067.1 hypothetical protein [Vibrio lentus]
MRFLILTLVLATEIGVGVTTLNTNIALSAMLSAVSTQHMSHSINKIISPTP